MMIHRRSFLVLALLAARAAPVFAAGGEMLVYVGTYTRGASKGIYLFRLDLSSGALTSVGLAGEMVNPSFLTIHRNRRFLYAVGETNEFAGQKSGVVSAFAIDPGTHKLTLLNQQPSGGGGPCYLVVDRSGKYVLLANYGGGSVSALPIGADGKLGPATAFIQHSGSSVDRQRQSSPHAHSINVDRANRYAVAADLGLDKLLVYKFDAAKGTLAPNAEPFAALKPGAGPRHFAFHPNGRFGYVINEMHCTVTALAYEAKTGRFRELQTISTLPGAVEKGFSTAEVQVHPSGRFLYGSNRGHDSIAVFSIDQKKGTLTAVEQEPTQGKIPRNFGIDPTGTFLLAANQNSDSIVVFRIDPKTGALEPTGHKAEAPIPVCVKFLPPGK
jgi:6-phosphogluconolactonase